jgi:hypothetical protein
MKINVTARWIAVFALALVALAAATGVAQGAAKPAAMSKAEYRALMIRSEALNEKYRLGEWKGVPAGMTPPQYRAIMIRSEALNKRYGLGPSAAATSTAAPSVSSHGFAWGAFGIGLAAMLGLVLVAAGVTAGRRYTRVTPRIRTT